MAECSLAKVDGKFYAVFTIDDVEVERVEVNNVGEIAQAIDDFAEKTGQQVIEQGLGHD